MNRAIWQGSIVFVLIWLVQVVFPRIQPTIRCWLWRIAYLKLLVSLLAEPLYIPWLFFTKISFSPVIRWLDTNPVDQLITSQPVPGIDPTNYLPWYSNSRLWFLLWILGISWSGIQLVVLWRRNQIAVKNCCPVADPVSVNLYQELCGQLKIHKPPCLYQSYSFDSPSLCGMIQPKIILPAEIGSQYKTEEIKMMLAHELAHYRRGDLFWNWLPEIARGLFFFHPMVWMAERQLRDLPEVCCDHLAVQFTGTRSVDYGKVLVKTTLQPVSKWKEHWLLAGVTGFYRTGSSLTLIKRLKALEDIRPIHPKWVFISAITLVLLSLAVVLPWQLSPTGIKFVVVRVSYPNHYTLNFFASLQADQLYIQDFKVEIDNQKVYEGFSVNSFGEIRFNTLSGYLLMDNSLVQKGSYQIKVSVHTPLGIFQKKYLVHLHDQELWTNYSLL